MGYTEPVCDCGHAKRTHYRRDHQLGRCKANACGCRQYRAPIVPAGEVPS